MKKTGQALPTAAQFVKRLRELASPDHVPKVARYFSAAQGGLAKDNKIMGVVIGRVFPAAKAFMQMGLGDIEKLLDSPFYEVRLGAVSVMDFQARAKSTSATQKQALYALYIRRHDRINNWDMVDRAAPYVVGGYLIDKPREVLYTLAASSNPWERRTAIVSTYFFIRAGEVADTFRIATRLIADEHELIHKAVGSWLREAGKKDRERLVRFLDKHGAEMNRTTLRYAVERFDEKTRKRYLARHTPTMRA